MLRSFLRVLGVALLVILILVFALWLGLLIYGRITFAELFPIRSKLARNPGLSNGLVPQGLTWNGDAGLFHTCGYMTGGKASRIYSVDSHSGEVRFNPLVSNGEPFYGHTGGLQYDSGFMYLADEGSGVYFFGADFPASGEDLEIGEAIPVNNNSSFVFALDGFVYVGEFNDGEKYICRNDFSYNGKNHKAIVSKYRAGDFSEPVCVYSIGDRIQGFAMLADGTIVLSQSYGLSPSRFLVYEPDVQLPTGKTMHGAEVFFLGEPSRIISAPPMSEDLDVRDGKVVYMTESASRKYLYGNLYFDWYIYALDIPSGAKDAGLISVPNPVEASSAQEILDKLGLSFAVPEEADGVEYFIVAGTVAQMKFDWNGFACTARIKSSSQLEDISGMYYDWQNAKPCEIGWCNGNVFWQDKGTPQENKGICLWYDAAPGLTYSLSLNGGASEASLLRLAGEVYTVSQKDAP